MEDRVTTYRDRRFAGGRLATGLAGFRGFLAVVMILLLAVLLVWQYSKNEIGWAIRDRIEAQANALLAPRGLQLTIQRCRLEEGRGIYVENAVLGPEGPGDPLVTIADCFVEINAYLPQLILGQQQITGIEIRNARFNLERDQAGVWNIEQFADLFEGPSAAGKLPPVFIRDSGIVIAAPLGGHAHPIQLGDINLDIRQQVSQGTSGTPQNSLTLQGYLGANVVDRIELAAQVDLQTRRWALVAEAEGAQIDRRLIDWFPADVHDQLKFASSFRGKLDLRGTVRGGLDPADLPQFSVTGRLYETTVDDDALPFPLTQVSCEFSAQNDLCQVSKLRGKAGSATFDLNATLQGITAQAAWSVEGQLDNLELRSELFPWLPPNLQKTWQEFSPTGTADFDFAIGSDGRRVHSRILTALRGASFSYYKYPYRIHDCRGTVDWSNEHCSVELVAEDNGQPVEFSGEFQDPGPGWTGQLHITMHGYSAIDDKILAAMQYHPKVLQCIKDFSPLGQFNLVSTIGRSDPRHEPAQHTRIKIRNGSIRYKHFPYPFYNVSGDIIVQDERITYSNVKGFRDNGMAVCNGEWTEAKGLDLQFVAHTVPLDDQLRNALSPGMQGLWDQIRPSGTLDDVTMDLKYQTDWEIPQIKLRVDLHRKQAGVNSAVAILPRSFPYEFSDVTGTFVYAGDRVTLQNVTASHGDSWFSAQGLCLFDSKSWKINFTDFVAGSIPIDNDLLFAVPGELETALRATQFDGSLHIEGGLSIAGTSVESASSNDASATGTGDLRLEWDCVVTTTAASLYVGIDLENITGQVRMRGQSVGERFATTGTVDIDSLLYDGIQLTRASGPLAIDNNSLTLGRSTSASENADPKPVRGTLFGGAVEVDARVLASRNGDFTLRMMFQDFSLRHAIAELGGDASQISGAGFGGIVLSGDQVGSNSLKGNGFLRLRQAQIYELPLILSLLKVTRAPFDRSAFDEANADFTLMGTDVELNRLELIGDAISLIGNGKMNLDQEIDLNFYSVVGRNRLNIPVLSQLYRASSQQILWVRVDGTLHEPQTHQEILPAISDTLRQVFEDIESAGLDGEWIRNGSFSPLPRLTQ